MMRTTGSTRRLTARLKKDNGAGVFSLSLARKTRDMPHFLEACAGYLDRSASRSAANCSPHPSRL